MRRLLGLVVIAAAIATAAQASAQSPNQEAARHFVEGKRLRDEKRYSEAVNELKQSLAIEKSIGAHYNLGVCFEKLKRHREAFDEYSKALELAEAKGDDREREIRAQLADFLKQAPHLRLAIPREVLSDVKITIDGDPIARGDIKTETKYFPPDGDKERYIVVASAPGYEDRTITVEGSSIRKSEKDLIPVVMRRVVDAAPAPPPPVEEGGWTWQHFAGIGGLVVGSAGVTVALATFIPYVVEKDNLEEKFEKACVLDRDPACTNQERDEQKKIRDEYDRNEASAKRNAPVVIGTGIGGALLIGGGVVLLLTAPRISPEKKDTSRAIDVQVVPTIGARQQGLSVVGRF